MEKQKTKTIYKLCSDGTDRVYIGSTTMSLCRRLRIHFNAYRSCPKKVGSAKELFDIPDSHISIVPLEYVKYNSIRSLRMKLRKHIQNCPTAVNRKRPILLKSDQYQLALKKIQNAKEQYLKNGKEHYLKNREQILEKRRNKRVICSCGRDLRKDCILKHKRNKLHVKKLEEQYEHLKLAVNNIQT